MPSTLRYGAGSTVEVDLEPQRLLAACGDSPAGGLVDPAAALAAAVAAPLDFPPLAHAVFPGDRVVLAVEEGVPQAAAHCRSARSSAAGCRIGCRAIFAFFKPRRRPTFRLPNCKSDSRSGMAAALKIVVHDAKTREGLSYLAADEAGEPIYINRRLFDADVVLPIGCLRLESSLGYYGVNGTLYPAFSDLPTQERFHATGVDPAAEQIAHAAARGR